MSTEAARRATGYREVFCTRSDCAFAGDVAPPAFDADPEFTRRVYYRCDANIVILDRREKFGRTCARFAKKSTPPAETKGG